MDDHDQSLSSRFMARVRTVFRKEMEAAQDYQIHNSEAQHVAKEFATADFLRHATGHAHRLVSRLDGADKPTEGAAQAEVTRTWDYLDKPFIERHPGFFGDEAPNELPRESAGEVMRRAQGEQDQDPPAQTLGQGQAQVQKL